MMRDEKLKKVLEKWDTPGPSGRLDARVWETYTQTRRRTVRWKLWGAIAAGVLLAVGFSIRKPFSPVTPPGGPRIETKLAGAGFQPLEDGAITVVKTGARR